jgi:hypothetical protein
MGGNALGGERQQSRNWGLFLVLVLCVDFWLAVTTVIARHI